MYERFRRRVDDHASARSQDPFLPPRAGELAAQDAGTSEAAAGAANPVVEVEGVYVISVAARILDMHPQTLRKYERLGLINPGRSVGMLRLYSQEDIRKLYLIRHLVENLGFNLAGVEFTLTLVDQLMEMRARINAAAAGTPLAQVLEQEIAHLFHALNLPVDSGSI
ncbi:MAG: MerR family transcriptional regulator [SAR202 cluster bacterium]|nr:MerR family transcriptional regulator [SAR202 cluster bacterium]